jgi:pilus assembly protein Flp/PilA
MSKIKNWAVSKVAAYQIATNDEEGQGLAEYGLILALIAVVCIGALGVLGTGISSKLQQVAGAL